MQATDGERHLDGLRAAEDHLQTVDHRDEDLMWQALLNCLVWLFRCEEREKAARADYYAVRDAAPGGPTLAALIYFRGQVEHAKQGHPYRLGAVPAKRFIKTVDGTVEAKRFIKTADGWVEAKSYIARYVFPPLHAGAPVDKNGRDGLYRQLVEGRQLVHAISEARAFLESC
ncbi:MAG: hypothetical protein K0R60_6 [Microbacterium sp.]|jgi:hypothetical protein|nr:hypothetical protein [Microbacterium sp.]